MEPILCKDFMSASATHFKGKIMICGTCVREINPDKFCDLAQGRTVYTFCPEKNHASLLGYKLTTIMRTCAIEDILVFTKDGSPHCAQILTTLQEAAENVGFPKSKLKYFVAKRGKFSEINDLTIRKSRNIMEIEDLMKFNKLHEVVKILTAPDGCPNDKKETFESVLDYLGKELKELKEGYRIGDWGNAEEELGDILFNIFLFSEVADKKGKFNILNLFENTANKFIKKHPKIFSGKKIK